MCRSSLSLVMLWAGKGGTPTGIFPCSQCCVGPILAVLTVLAGCATATRRKMGFGAYRFWLAEWALGPCLSYSPRWVPRISHFTLYKAPGG